MDIFEFLKADKNCEISLLRSKCQRIIKECHPDKNGGKESMDFLNAMKIWEILNDKDQFEKVKSLQCSRSQANWNTFSLNEMHEDPTQYSKECRCGDQYLLPKSEVTEDETEYCIECETCSNTITVTCNT